MKSFAIERLRRNSKPLTVPAAGTTCRIWCDERGGWWRPKAQGYTDSFEQAGVFTLTEAMYQTDGLGKEKRIRLDVAWNYPIIFSAAMIQALLAGRKTTTRRLAWRRAEMELPDGSVLDLGQDKTRPTPWQSVRDGDKLWVKENAWICPPAWTNTPANPMGPHDQEVAYQADDKRGGTAEAARDYNLKLTPSIHMPRWASRMTLSVTGNKVEPLQSISEADAIAEGIEPVMYDGKDPQFIGMRAWKSYETYPDGTRHPHAVAPNRSPITSYEELWKSLHGHDSWAENPDVCAPCFTVDQRNIDTLKVAA